MARCGNSFAKHRHVDTVAGKCRTVYGYAGSTESAGTAALAHRPRISFGGRGRRYRFP